MRMPPALIASAAIGLVFACAGPALAQTAAELFDPNAIQEIRLSVNSRDLRTVRANTQLNTYYTADLTWKSVKVRNVGIRSRGQGSRNPTKPGFRVDMANLSGSALGVVSPKRRRPSLPASGPSSVGAPPRPGARGSPVPPP